MPDLDMQGRVALITGAAGGLGKSYALALAARGAAVVVNDLGGDTRGGGGSAHLAEQVVDEIKAAGGLAVASMDSVATKAGGEAMVQTAIDAFGRIDIVINNAGNQRNALFENLSEDDIDSVLAVHLKGTFFVTQPAYRLMKQQGYGRIVLTSSQSGMFGNPYRANYGAAKTAMMGLMNVLAQEAPPGVAVNCILPNAIGGRMGDAAEVRVDADFMKEGAKRLGPVISMMDAAYVTALIVYLCSEACTTSQSMYSVLAGRYARVFVGVTEGWLAPAGVIPTAEDVVRNLGTIEDMRHFAQALSGLAEMDGVLVKRTVPAR